MGKYNFDEVIDRHGTDCLKYDFVMKRKGRDDLLPLWVADMDFRLPDEILDEFHKRIDHGIFGYTDPLDEYFDAMNHWFSTRYGYTIKPEWVTLGAGIVYALGTSVKAFTEEGDAMMVIQPVYYPFSEVIKNDGRKLVNCQLRYENNRYSIDFEKMEQMIKEENVKALIFCNPHNPAGRVWTPDELTRLGNICLRNGVTVVADEIHCELVYQGFKYTPFASLSDAFLHRSVTCVSPSKAFNIAGLQIANIVAFDNDLRSRIDKAININEVCDVNPFGVAATIAAYNEGEEWLNQLVDYLHGNYEAMAEFCRRELSEFPITRLEGTYLVWMDCSSLGMPSDALEHALLEDARLWLNAGTMYGAEGEGYMRWNIACPRSVMLDGLNRFLNFVRSR